MRPCTCDRFRGPIFQPGDCRLCWLYRHDSRYRELWDRDDTAPSLRNMADRGQCHQLELVSDPAGGAAALAVNCCGGFTIPVLTCHHPAHGPHTTWAKCWECPDFSRRESKDLAPTFRPAPEPAAQAGEKQGV